MILRLVPVVLALATALRVPFTLTASVQWGGLPMAATVLELPSLGTKVEADSLGRVRLRGDLPPGCRTAHLHVLGYGSFVWSFDPAVPRTWDAGALVLESRPPAEAPLRIIDGCAIPQDSLVAWSEGFAGLDTVLVLH